jgi:hypothetical protein
MAKRNGEKLAVNEYRRLFHGEEIQETHHVKTILGGGWYVPAYGCCGIDGRRLCRSCAIVNSYLLTFSPNRVLYYVRHCARVHHGESDVANARACARAAVGLAAFYGFVA